MMMGHIISGGLISMYGESSNPYVGSQARM
jgi:hypothetical protein